MSESYPYMEELKKSFYDIPLFDPRKIVIEDWEIDRIMVSTTVESGLINPYGTIHGGYLTYLADTVAGYTAATDGRAYVTQSCGFEFLSNRTNGRYFIEGTVIYRGARVCVIRVRIFDELDKPLCEGTFNMYTLHKKR